MTVNPFSGGNNPYPSGTIIMWYGNPKSLPHGWNLCDGNNGTPDLRDKFIRSIPSATTEPGTTGGTDSFVLSESTIPSHSHGASTSSDGSHKHTWTYGDKKERSSTDFTSGVAGKYRTETTTNGAHSHSFYTTYTGGADSIDNRPSHVEMAYIQKE